MYVKRRSELVRDRRRDIGRRRSERDVEVPRGGAIGAEELRRETFGRTGGAHGLGLLGEIQESNNYQNVN